MARPRFHNLPEEQQSTILAAALTEFAAHGYRDASLNRIIEASGVSKGSMYYYFDSKVDLYAHLIRAQFDVVAAKAGPLGALDSQSPDAFWGSLEKYYLSLMEALLETPAAATLLRGWLSSPVELPLAEAEQAILPWLMRTIAIGQGIGAVRTDIPMDLLVGVAMGVGGAMDTWLITQTPDRAELASGVGMLMGMIRRAVGA
jgi:AcrR family transcriptional regulator